jgi:hypothetical protein
MTKKLLALYGLKWNPFAPDVPVDALHDGADRSSYASAGNRTSMPRSCGPSSRTQSFCWRVDQHRR